MNAMFLRLNECTDKPQALSQTVAAVRKGEMPQAAHFVEPAEFNTLPESRFLYWIGATIRHLFSTHASIARLGGMTRCGLGTLDDFRFFRGLHEVDYTRVGERWVPTSKGGGRAPYYCKHFILLNWADGGVELKAFVADKVGSASRKIQSENFYFIGGATWPRRPLKRGAFSVLPRGTIFTDNGPFLAPPAGQFWECMAIINSSPFIYLLELNSTRGGGRSAATLIYEAGTVALTPFPELRDEPASRHLAELARNAWRLWRVTDTTVETSLAFILPGLAQVTGRTLMERASAWRIHIEAARETLLRLQREVDDYAFALYRITDEDRKAIEAGLGSESRGFPESEAVDQAVADLFSWVIGVAMGRFDVRFATGDRRLPEPPDPLEPVPAQPASMLPASGASSGYPLRVAADGILVDDEGHDWDIVARVRDVLHLVFGDEADALEREGCQLLAVPSLHDYLTRAGVKGFWDRHVKRYSKNQRRAPIYWLLQSPRGLYSAWIYYHRLNRDTLHRLLGSNYLGSRIQRVRRAIEELRPGGQTKPSITKKEERTLADLDDLLVDLEEFSAKIQTIITRANDRGETVGYDPDLDDGVVLSAAPLHDLIPWQRKKRHLAKAVNELETYWEELAGGKYDWAHIAMRYWPTRVTERCRSDKSLALAHGLDAQFFPGLRDELRREADAAGATTPDDEDLMDNEVEEEEEE